MLDTTAPASTSPALLTALLPPVESLEPAGTPIRHHNNTLRAWHSLPIRVKPSASARPV